MATAVKNSNKRANTNPEFSYVVGIQLAELDKTADESGEPKREIVITCLQEGPGNQVDNRYYSRKAVEGLENKIYSRRKLFVDHLISDDDRTKGDSLKDWAGTVLKTWLEEQDGKVVRKVRVKIHEDWLWRRCQDAPGEIAISIEGRGVGDKGMVEGKEYYVVEDIPYLSALKFVPYPGNAKMGANLVEGQATDIQEETMDWSKVTLEALREGCPNLVAAIEKSAVETAEKKITENAAKAEAAVTALAEAKKTIEGLTAKSGTLEEQLKASEKAKDGDAKALTEQFRSEMKSGFAEQAKVIESLREENHALKSRLDDKEVRERIMAKDTLIDALLKESDLPEEAKTPLFRDDLRRLTERKEGDKIVATIEEQIKARIVDRKKLCAGGEAVVTGSGVAAPVVEKAEPKNAVEEQVVIDEMFRRKYSREYGMSLTPDNVLVEYRKRQAEAKK